MAYLPRGRLAYRGSINAGDFYQQPPTSIPKVTLTREWCQLKNGYSRHEIVFIGSVATPQGRAGRLSPPKRSQRALQRDSDELAAGPTWVFWNNCCNEAFTAPSVTPSRARQSACGGALQKPPDAPVLPLVEPRSWADLFPLLNLVGHELADLLVDPHFS